MNKISKPTECQHDIGAYSFCYKCGKSAKELLEDAVAHIKELEIANERMRIVGLDNIEIAAKLERQVEELKGVLLEAKLYAYEDHIDLHDKTCTCRWCKWGRALTQTECEHKWDGENECLKCGQFLASQPTEEKP